MLRLLGCLLLAGGASFLGFSAAAQLERRVKALRGMRSALELMERELTFRLTPMPELLDGLALRATPPVNRFFAKCRLGMDTLDEKSLARLWRESLRLVPMDLAEEELALLGDLGDVLGQYDGERQREALALTRLSLTKCLEHAEEDRTRQGRVYGTLGLSAGAILVILLI